jgi:hypothetical protein
MLNMCFPNAGVAATWCAKNADVWCMVLVAPRDKRRRPDVWEWKIVPPYPLPQLFSRYDLTTSWRTRCRARQWGSSVAAN